MAAFVRPLIAYYRVSTDRQGHSGLGLEAQQHAVRGFAREKGLDIIAEFTEVESGKMSERPQLSKALQLAQQMHATLAVAKLDRLARDAAFVLNLRSSGVEFLAVDMPQANRLLIGIMALVAEYEGEQISQRTRDALARARANGVKLGGWRGRPGESPADVTARGRATMTENAKRRRAELMPTVAAVFAVNDGNYAATADQLNASGLRTPSGRGRWHARQLKTYVDRGELVIEPKPRRKGA